MDKRNDVIINNDDFGVKVAYKGEYQSILEEKTDDKFIVINLIFISVFIIPIQKYHS